MRIAAALASVAVLLCYGLLASRSASYGMFAPRGGALMLAISLVLANLAAWAAAQAERPLRQRFQLLLAAWIWLLVQSGCMAYLLHADA